MKRAIVLFPDFYNMDVIQEIRENHDPLVHCIAPHLTLVFPFESDLSTDELQQHCDARLKGMKSFHILLKGITGDFRDGYLFLNVKEGNDSVIELHDRLYSGVLERFLCRKITYCPHLTVGKLQNPRDFENALDRLSHCEETFEAVIDKVCVECIDDLSNSKIELSSGLI